MKIAIVVATSANGIIGSNGQIPWDIPEDRKHFRSVTTGHHIVMGRKTQESIGKPLKNRTNLVLSRNNEYQPEGFVVFPTLEEAIQFAKNNGEEELMIIGGEQIYSLAIPRSDKIYLTTVYKEYEGDTFFPKLTEEWLQTSNQYHEGDPPYEFKTFERRV